MHGKGQNTPMLCCTCFFKCLYSSCVVTNTLLKMKIIKLKELKELSYSVN